MGEVTFDLLRETIEKVRSSGIAEWSVTDETAVAATAYANLLEAAGARCPRMFILEEECIVFTWDEEGRKHFLNISSDDVGSAMSFAREQPREANHGRS